MINSTDTLTENMVHSEYRGSWNIVQPHGDWDLTNIETLRTQLEEAMEDTPPYIVVDLSDLTFMDSSILGLLAGTTGKCRERGGTLRVACARHATAKLISVSGLAPLFGSWSSVDEATSTLLTPTEKATDLEDL